MSVWVYLSGVCVLVNGLMAALLFLVTGGASTLYLALVLFGLVTLVMNLEDVREGRPGG